jgi:hypothetical protein
MNDTALVEEVQRRALHSRAVVRTYSFSEIGSMYTAGELEISPLYQRLFRWSDQKQSQFIESLLLELPLPPIFMIQRTDERYELVDGLQRVSTYLRFTGAFKKAKKSEFDPSFYDAVKLPLVLEGCDIVPELNGKSYDQLPTALGIRLRRSAIPVSIVQLGSDPDLRYFMFKRLNTGGEQLTAQEARSSFTRMYNPAAVDFIARLSNDKSFKKCILPITEDAREKRFDQELVLRFLAIVFAPETFKHDVDPFLTSFLEDIAFGRRDQDTMESIFASTFKALAVACGDSSFTLDGKNQFSALHFEGIAGAVARCLKAGTLPDAASMRKRIKALKKSDPFLRVAKGGGKNSSAQLKKRIEVAYEALTIDAAG